MRSTLKKVHLFYNLIFPLSLLPAKYASHHLGKTSHLAAIQCTQTSFPFPHNDQFMTLLELNANKVL